MVECPCGGGGSSLYPLSLHKCTLVFVFRYTSEFLYSSVSLGLPLTPSAAIGPYCSSSHLLQGSLRHLFPSENYLEAALAAPLYSVWSQGPCHPTH